MTPCEILTNYNINTQTCEFAKMDARAAENSNSIYKYAAEVHGRGFVIITQYALLIVEAFDHFVQALKELVQTFPDCHICHF